MNGRARGERRSPAAVCEWPSLRFTIRQRDGSVSSVSYQAEPMRAVGLAAAYVRLLGGELVEAGFG